MSLNSPKDAVDSSFRENKAPKSALSTQAYPPLAAQRFGFVTLCGAPNAGKSTLLNRLMGQKVAAVSNKAQTTRFNIVAVKEYETDQIAFVDTPGLFQTETPTGRWLRKSARNALKQTDQVVILVDLLAKNQAAMDLIPKILTRLKSSETTACPVFLAFNKIDQLKKSDIIARVFPFQKYTDITDFFMISAETGEGVAALVQSLRAQLSTGPWAYPPQSALQMDFKQWLSEMTMEKIFENLHQEVPYQIYIETLSINEEEDGLHIYQNIIVAKSGQKAIVIGHKGQTLKHIGMRARQDIGGVLGRRVHLHLLVKVIEDWPSRSRCLIDAGFTEAS